MDRTIEINKKDLIDAIFYTINSFYTYNENDFWLFFDGIYCRKFLNDDASLIKIIKKTLRLIL